MKFLRLWLICPVIIQLTVAMDMKNMTDMSKRGLDRLRIYLSDFCPSVQLVQQFDRYANCVNSTEKSIGNAATDASVSQLCNNLNRYMECNKPWIDAMRKCNHIRVDDVLHVIEAAIEALMFACQNGGQRISDFFEEKAESCLMPNMLNCSTVLIPPFESYLSESKHHSTYFTSQNCRILEIVANCTVEASVSCTTQKSVSLFGNVSDILSSHTCRSTPVVPSSTPALPTTRKTNVAVSSTVEPFVSDNSAPISLTSTCTLALAIVCRYLLIG